MSKPKPIPAKESLNFKHKAGVLLVSLSAVLLEFTLIRVLSVSLWYHFAFMIISIAMLGIGVSGVILASSHRLNKIQTSILLPVISMAYACSILISFILINRIPFDPFSLLVEAIQWIYLPIYYLLIVLPFLLAGLIIGVLFSRFQTGINRLYFFDLVGAGLSVFVFVFVLPKFGGSGGVAAASVIAALASFLFCIGLPRYRMTGYTTAFLLIVLNLLFLVNPDRFLPVEVSKNKVYGNFIRENPDLKVLTEWNSFSRVDVMLDEEEPIDAYPVYTAIVDAGNSTTNIPNVPAAMDSFPPPMDASNLAMILKNDSANVYIIGSGGGGEIVSALSHNAKSITAVEINGILNELITKTFANTWTAGLAQNKKVKIITDDARGYLKGKRIKYDVIISAHTISASAVASGAMSLVENYILTLDAVKDYFVHLTPQGILYISRPESQIPRLITTLNTAYRELYNLDSKKNFLVFKRPPSPFEKDKSFLAGVVYKKDGFDQYDIMRLKTQAGVLGLNIEYDPVSNQEGMYRDLIEGNPPPINLGNLNPVTDDNPYFEHQTNFLDLKPEMFKSAFAQTDRAVLELTQNPAAEATLVVILFQTIIIAGVLIFMPLYISRNGASTRNVVSSYSKWKLILYFACLGLGYIMIEIALIQRFTLFLGQPVYTMLTIISGMLIFSGIGSALSVKILKVLKNTIYVFASIAVLTILIAVVNGFIFNALVRADIYWKILVSILMIAPLAFCMGMPFPIGMSRIATSPPTPLSKGEGTTNAVVAYAWGVNGFFSVIGAVAAVMLSMSYGFKMVFVISAAIYVGAMLAGRKM